MDSGCNIHRVTWPIYVLAPTCPPSLGTGISFTNVKCQEHEANHSPASSADVKNVWCSTPTVPLPLYCLYSEVGLHELTTRWHSVNKPLELYSTPTKAIRFSWFLSYQNSFLKSLSYVTLRHVIWYKLTDVLEVPTASIIRGIHINDKILAFFNAVLMISTTFHSL